MQYVIPATMVKTSTCMPPDFTKGRRRTFVRHHWSNVIALFKRRQYRANRTCRIRNPILNFFDDDVNLTMMNEEGTIERSARLPDENADVDIQKSTTSSGKRSSTTTKTHPFLFCSTMVAQHHGSRRPAVMVWRPPRITAGRQDGSAGRRDLVYRSTGGTFSTESTTNFVVFSIFPNFHVFFSSLFFDRKDITNGCSIEWLSSIEVKEVFACTLNPMVSKWNY